jgi:chromosome segregation ATPase
MKAGVVYLAFIALAAMIVIGAWNGKFSPRAEAIPVTQTKEFEELKKEMERVKEEAKQASDDSFRFENAVGELTGVRDDSAAKIRELMETIGSLSEENNELRDENEKLRKLLRELSADFEELRKRLKICEANEASRRIEAQYCIRDPPSNLLL